MTIGEEDLNRVRDNYTDPDEAVSRDSLRNQLESEGFEGQSLDAFADAVAADQDVAADETALVQAQQQAVESLGSGGAVSSQLVRAEGGKTIGAPSNVEQRIERTGPNSGDVIAKNQNTGTEGKIGEVDLVNPNRAIDGGAT